MGERVSGEWQALPNIVHVGRTNEGWLSVGVDFGDHQNDFLFPDTEDPETIKRVIRVWRESHEATGDQRSRQEITLIPNHELLGEVGPAPIPPSPPPPLPADEFGRLMEYDEPDE